MKRNPRRRRGALPDSTPAFLESPIAHCRLILEQLNYSTSKIDAIEQRCARAAYQSRYYAAASHSLFLPEKNDIAIQELLVQVARFKRAYPAKNLEELVAIAYDIGLLQGALFSLDKSLKDGRRGAKRAAEAKGALSAEVSSDFERVRQEMTAQHGRPPTGKEIIHRVLADRKARRLTVRSPSWCYNLLKNSK